MQKLTKVRPSSNSNWGSHNGYSGFHSRDRDTLSSSDSNIKVSQTLKKTFSNIKNGAEGSTDECPESTSSSGHTTDRNSGSATCTTRIEIYLWLRNQKPIGTAQKNSILFPAIVWMSTGEGRNGSKNTVNLDKQKLLLKVDTDVAYMEK